MKICKSKTFICAVAICLLAGCTPKMKRLLGQLEKPQNQITINQIVKYPRAKNLEKEISTFSGRKIWINVNSLLPSKYIKKVELVPREKSGKYYDLKLFMNSKGLIRWMSISSGFRDEPLAFVIDGIFYRSFIAKPIVGNYETDETNTYVTVEGPFDKATAETLAEWAPKNYEFFNADDD